MVGTRADERLAFLTEWLDPQAGLVRRYQLFFYTPDQTVEMFDIKNRRIFLKRSKPAGNLTERELFVGATITLNGRQLNLVEYGDAYTASKMDGQRESTLAMIKPDAVAAGATGKVIDAVLKAGLLISQLRMTHMSPADAARFYAEHEGKPFYSDLCAFMSSGRVVAMELVGPGAIAKWREIIGPTNTQKARQEAPGSLRAQFGTDGTQNACHGSDSPSSAAREVSFFFGPDGRALVQTALMSEGVTLGIIKPKSFRKGFTGAILDAVLAAGYQITAMQVFNMDRPNALEFLEVYRGVVPEYNAMVEELTSGQLLAFEVSGYGDMTVAAFRELCGPVDPEIAKTLRPNTIRALYGADKVSNAIHCTDLNQDGVLESQYFFSVLQ